MNIAAGIFLFVLIGSPVVLTCWVLLDLMSPPTILKALTKIVLGIITNILWMSAPGSHLSIPYLSLAMVGLGLLATLLGLADMVAVRSRHQ